MTDREPHGRKTEMKMISRISLAFALTIGAVAGAQLVPGGSTGHDGAYLDRVDPDAARDGSASNVVQSLQNSSPARSDASAMRDGVISAAVTPMNAPTSADVLVDRIMFASNRGGTFDLYSMNDDGTDVRMVVGGPRDELHSDLSPDGRRIVFVRADDAARPFGAGCCGPAVDVFVADADGSGVAPLLVHPLFDDYRPDWSPDGSRIAFSRAAGVVVSNIFTVKPDGTELHQVTEGILGNNVASWSPDGTQLVFVSTRGGAVELWITDADGSNPHALTDSDPGVLNTSPQWSPTGEWIVFGSTRDGGASELYTIRPDGSDLTRLTTNTVSDSYGTWSPDGKRIAVSRGSMSSGTIWVMDADGSDQRQISDGPLDTFPVYFPRAT